MCRGWKGEILCGKVRIIGVIQQWLVWEELGLERCHSLSVCRKTSGCVGEELCISCSFLDCSFSQLCIFLQFPWLPLFPPQLSVPRVRMATNCSPAWESPKNEFTGGATVSRLNWGMWNDFWSEGTWLWLSTHFLGLGGILFSWNPDFGHLGVCRKAGTQETKGSHYSPPNFELFWHRTGILIIFSLILQFFGSAHTTNLLHHMRKEEELSHLNVWTHLGFF